ncbi:MAG: methionyl-tRNA formyltransferase [bacterium]
MRVLFCGTPKIAIPSLRAAADGGRAIVGVMTQPDRPQGRGLHARPSPVKEDALAQGLRVLEPERPRDARALLEALRPDVIVVVAYGHIFRRWLLELAPLGCVNVHFSLLPRHRGPAPVAWAIVLGDAETGVTTMRLDEGVDTGPVYLHERVAVTGDDTQETLGARLADAGAVLLARTLDGLAAGSVVAAPQPAEGATHARLLVAEDGRVDWTKDARAIDRQVRGLDPWPGAFTTWRGKRLRLHAVRPREGALEPGRIVVERAQVLVGTGEGALELVTVQPEGKPSMGGDAWARGARPREREALGT